MDVETMLSKVKSQGVMLELLFDGQAPSCVGRLSEPRTGPDGDQVVIEVTDGEANPGATVVRVRAAVDQVLYEFGGLIVRWFADAVPSFVLRSPTDVHRVEQRAHIRVVPKSGVSLRVSMTVSGTWIPVELHNVSEGGVAFSSPDVGSFAVGHTVARLELTIDRDRPIVTSGLVKNVYTIRYPREIGPVYGIQWGRLAPDERGRLRSYVESNKRR